MITFPQPLTSIVSVFPDDSSSDSGEVFLVGSALGGVFSKSQSLLQTSLISTLFDGTGFPVLTMAWRSGLLAWADVECVRVKSTKTGEAICMLERPENGFGKNALCHLFWETDNSLLLGWEDQFRVIKVEEGHVEVDREGDEVFVEKKGEIVVEWEADCIICGLSPFDNETIAILGFLTFHFLLICLLIYVYIDMFQPLRMNHQWW